MQAKIKHLEFIQSTIGRMANNSFLLKGWSVTLCGALIAATFKDQNIRYLYVSFAVIVFMWFMDSYFLSRESLFRKLYDSVRIKKEEDIDFSMHTKDIACGCEWVMCSLSRTMFLFYGSLTLLHLLVFYLK